MMVQVDHSATSLLGKAPGILSLRVCGGSLDGQVVRLRSSKCSVGSGPHCTLRLRALGVDSLHCLILRGARGTIVRRLAAGTRLNGATFIDAPLRSGDRLCLGPVELEVVDDGRLQEGDVPVKEASVGTIDAVASSPIEQDVIGREQHDQAVEGLRCQTQQARSRTHNMLDALRSARGRIAELETTGAAGEAQRARDAQRYEQQEQDRDIERTELACRLEELSRDLELNNSENQVSQQQLTSLQAELNVARQSVQDASRQSAEEQADHLGQVKLRDAELASLRTQMEDSRQSWEARTAQEQKLANEQHEQQRSEWESDRQAQAERAESIERKLQQATSQLQRLEAERDSAVAMSERSLAEVEQKQDEVLGSERQKWESERADATARLERAQSELESQRRTWEQQCEQWQAERSTESNTHQARLREGLDALEEERAKFEQQQSEWSKNRQMDTEDVASSMQAALAEAEALSDDRRRFVLECEESRSQSDKQCEALEEQRQAWHEECQQWKEEQGEQELQLEQAQLELKEYRGALKQAQVQWDAQRKLEAQRLELSELENDSPSQAQSQDDDASVEDRESQLTDWYRQQEQVQQQRVLDSDADLDDSSPTDAADVSESLQLDAPGDEKMPAALGASLWAEDDSAQDEVSIPQTAAEITFEPVVDESRLIPTTPPSEDEEEESIDDYMAKLLQRVQGQSTAPVMHETALGMQEGLDVSAAVTEVDSASQPIEEEDSGAEPQPLPLRKRVEPFVMKPRSLPPELTSSLAAMRDLANSSARKAIDQSIQQRWLHAAIGKLVVGMTGLIGGAILLYWASDLAGLTFLSSLVAFLVAVFWGLQSAIIFRNLLTTPRVDDEAESIQDAAHADLIETPVSLIEEPATDSIHAEEEFDALENDLQDQAEPDSEL